MPVKCSLIGVVFDYKNSIVFYIERRVRWGGSRDRTRGGAPALTAIPGYLAAGIPFGILG